MQRRHRVSWCVSSSVLVVASAAAFADDLAVPREYPTVEAALAAASDGDRVVVRGTYENMHITRGDVQIVARGATVKGYVWIDAPNVTLSGFRLGPDGRIIVTGDDVTVSGTKASGHGRRSIAVQGGRRATIRGSKLVYGDIQVLLGEAATIERNKVLRGSIMTSDDGARIDSNVVPDVAAEGDDVQLLGNQCRWLGAAGDDCDVSGNKVIISLRVDGDRATVQSNETIGREELTVAGNAALVLGNEATDHGIRIWGDDAVIAENSVADTHHGIEVVGERFTIAENQVDVMGLPQRVFGGPAPTENPAIRTFSQTTGSAILSNDIEHFASPGIDVSGGGVNVAGNDLHGIAAGTSIQITGDANVVADNTIGHTQIAEGLGDGIAIVGNENVVQQNVVDGVPLDAILVWSGDGNVVTDNDIDAVPGCGIVVTCGASTTTVSDCNVTGCRFGLVNEGANTTLTDTSTLGNSVVDILDLSSGFTTFDGNTYTTISHDELIAPVTSLTDPPIVREGPIGAD